MSILKKARLANQQAPIGCVVSVMIELCNVLDYVSNCTDDDGERLRVVHRDLTPGNLLIADDGHLKVIDFGVAKALSGRFMTNTGMIKGKLGYMSVEALGGKDLDARTDIFSAGVVMWEMLAGRRLFNGKDELTVIQLVRTAQIPAPSVYNMNCPVELDEIVIKALQRYRDDRWETAGAMRLALDEVRRYYGDHASPLGVSRWKRKRVTSSAPRRAEERGRLCAADRSGTRPSN
jgi:serine/threonine protein kinase